MQIVVTLSDLEILDKLIELKVDAILVGEANHSVRMKTYLTKDEIKAAKLKCEKSNTKLFFNANLICHNDIVESYREFFKFLKEINIDGIYASDVALIELAEELGLTDKIIYNPETLITNSYDANFYLNQGIKAVSLGKEITLEDVKKIREKVKGNIEVFAHGIYSMYYTKRTIIKNYFDYREQEEDFLSNQNMSLIEETRKVSYPILEEKTGTAIFREATTSMIEYLEEMKPDFIRIDGLFKSNEYLLYVVKSYKEYLNGVSDKETFVKEFHETLTNKYNDTLDTGFLFKKTVHAK